MEDRISVTQKNVFGIAIAILSDWSVDLRGVLLGTGPPRTPPSNPPRPPLLMGRLGIETGSNQGIDVESMSNRC